MKLPRFIVLLPLATLLVMLGGCEKEGPAEQAGENLDETVEEIQEKAEDTTDMVMEKVEQAGDEIETATDSAVQ